MERNRTIRFAVASPFPESDAPPPTAGSAVDAKIDRLIESLEQLNKVLGTVRLPKAARATGPNAAQRALLRQPADPPPAPAVTPPVSPDRFGPLVSEIERSLWRYQGRPEPAPELPEPPVAASPEAEELLPTRPSDAEAVEGPVNDADKAPPVEEERPTVEVEIAALDAEIEHPAEPVSAALALDVSCDDAPPFATADVEALAPHPTDEETEATIEVAQVPPAVDPLPVASRSPFEVKPFLEETKALQSDTDGAVPRLTTRPVRPFSEIALPLGATFENAQRRVRPTFPVRAAAPAAKQVASRRTYAFWIGGVTTMAIGLAAVLAFPSKRPSEPIRPKVVSIPMAIKPTGLLQQVSLAATAAEDIGDVAATTTEERPVARANPSPELSPYRFPMLDQLLSPQEKAEPLASDLLDAIIRMEGMYDPTRLGPLGPSLRMQIRPGTASMTNVFGDRWLRTHIDPNIHYKVATYAISWLNPPAPDCANFAKIHAIENVLTLDMMAPSDCAGIQALSTQTHGAIAYQSVSAAPMSMPLFSAPYPGGRFTHEELLAVLETRAAVAQQLLWFKRGAQ